MDINKIVENNTRFKVKVIEHYQFRIKRFDSIEEYKINASPSIISVHHSDWEKFTFEIIPWGSRSDLPKSAVKSNLAWIFSKGVCTGLAEFDHLTLASEYLVFLDEEAEAVAPKAVCSCNIAIGGCNCEIGRSELKAERKAKGITTFYRGG